MEFIRNICRNIKSKKFTVANYRIPVCDGFEINHYRPNFRDIMYNMNLKFKQNRNSIMKQFNTVSTFPFMKVIQQIK